MAGGEVARRDREVRPRPAQHARRPARRRLDVVEGDRADDRDGVHSQRPAIGATAARTAGGITARSVMIAWRSASGQGPPARACRAPGPQGTVPPGGYGFAFTAPRTSSFWT